MIWRDGYDMSSIIDQRRQNHLREWIADLEKYEVDFIIAELLYQRKRLKRELSPIFFKVCDNDGRTFPQYTLNCDLCHNKKLRMVEIQHNHDAILDEFK